MFIMAVPEYMYLSSSAVKEIAAHGGTGARGSCPAHVHARLLERYGKGR